MKYSELLSRRLWLASLLMAGLVIFTQSVGAHTAGKLQLSAVAAGPYQLSVWTTPDPAGVGELHVALSVVSSAEAAPVLDATVMVEMSSMEDGSTFSGPATTENSENKFLYEAILEPTSPGNYIVTMQVVGSDGESGDVSFELEVIEDAGFNLLYLIPIVLVLATLFIVITTRRRKASLSE